MAIIMCKLCFLSIVLTFIYLPCTLAASAYYNVQSYGAKPDGKTDSTKALVAVWAAACASTAPATIYVPPGRFLVGGVSFQGQTCKTNAIRFQIDGTLVAPSDYNVFGKSGNCITFERVVGVSILGGTLDGQGAALWACKKSGKSCPQGATTLGFYHANNIVISGVSSQNSQMFHILIYGCHNAKLQGVRISAPENSPNTDGIHVQSSSGVTILNSHIGTGDDCISIGPGNSNLWIENIACGPGHGISIGSLGWEMEEGVQNVTVKTAKFTGTQNGVRIKTWARPSNGFVRNVIFQHAVMSNVQNPIIIDQNYCPNNQNCPHQGSGVKISGVTYQDIRGTSATEVAVKFECSKTEPCSEITLDHVNLTYDKDEKVEASCVNAGGTISGLVRPALSCF